MGDKPNYRLERIQRLLLELQHEVTRGMMEGEVEETLGFEFVVPVSKTIPDGIVMCRFQTRPAPRHYADLSEPRLRVVK